MAEIKKEVKLKKRRSLFLITLLIIAGIGVFYFKNSPIVAEAVSKLSADIYTAIINITSENTQSKSKLPYPVIVNEADGRSLKPYFVTPELYEPGTVKLSRSDVVKAFSVFPRDKSGIVTVMYYGAEHPEYNPVTVSNYALANWNIFIESGDEAAKEDFILHADWLVRNAVKDNANDCVWWLYEFDNPAFGARAPWKSAMAQGLSLSVLVRAYQLTGDRNYLDVARMTLNSFKVRIEDGGITDVDGGYRYYEEVAVQPAAHILNGFIFSIVGLHEYYLLTGDGMAEWLFKEGTKTVKHSLPKYLKFGGSYDLRLSRHFLEAKKPADPKYQRIHELQLEYLYQLTGEKEFYRYSRLLHSKDKDISFVE